MRSLSIRTRWSLLAVALALAAAGLLSAAPEERRVAAGHCVSPDGTLLQREATGKTWQALAKGAEIATTDRLLALPGVRAEVESANGGVHLVLWGNLPELSPLAVLESAVVVHDNPDFDLDITLERGRIVLVSTKDGKLARVRVRSHGQTWDVTLADQGDQAALEEYGRWPRGTTFMPKPDARHQPTADLVLLFLKGHGDLKAADQQFSLRAPPGPGYFHWDSVRGQDGAPQKLDAVPAWAAEDSGQTADARRVQVAVDRLLRQEQMEKDIIKALKEMRTSASVNPDAAKSAMVRRLAVLSLAAINDLPDLFACLEDARDAEVRATAVEALRHWIGRGPHQDQQLYGFLMKEEKYMAGRAATVLELLHTPFDSEQPETYETLINYLRHEKLPVRELARWHLYRLAPAGKTIPYDAGAAEAERDRAVERWKKLIPSGKLPPSR